MKKWLLLFILLFLPNVVYAASISNIDMDITLDKSGNATIVETWDAYVDQGTEGYHPYYNIGNSSISNVSASMDGIEFTTINDWHISNSFSEKSYKAGIYRTGDEIDLCFGISKYGQHKYKLSYNISNFVSEIVDGDMIYWNLFPKKFSNEPDNVDISIHSDFEYKNIEIFGYGKGGAYNTLEDGKISITSQGKVYNNEYLTVLIKFPDETFESSNIIDKDFEYYHNMADKGAISYEDPEEKNDESDTISSILFSVFSFLAFFLVLFRIISILNLNKYDFGEIGNRIKKDVLPFRDIPYNKDIFKAYWLSNNYNIGKKKEDFLGALLLKWLCNKNISIEKVEKKGLLKTTTLNNIIFINLPSDANEYEKTMYNWMVEASKDGKLESGEFSNWCKTKYSSVLNWFDNTEKYVRDILVEENKITVVDTTTLKVIKGKKYVVDSSLYDEAQKLAGLKKFLKEFTLIKEREAIEVNLWQYYLIYAQIFGIADEVASQFKKLYPEIISDMDSVGYNYDDILFLNMISNNAIRSANSANSSANSSNFSSFGGGGGSFGSGGGGGGFR